MRYWAAEARAYLYLALAGALYWLGYAWGLILDACEWVAERFGDGRYDARHR